MNEQTRERAIDREVQSRLARDRAYLNAENADEQSEREADIEAQVVAEFEADDRDRAEQQVAYDERWYR